MIAQVHMPLLNLAFGSVPLALDLFAVRVSVACGVPWIRELSKCVAQARSGAGQ